MAKIRQPSDAFGGKQTEETNAVVIVPSGVNPAGTYNFPDNTKASDYEEIHVFMGHTGGAEVYDSQFLDKEVLSTAGWRIRCFYDRANVAYGLRVRDSGLGDSSFIVDLVEGGAHLLTMIGYKKKYATTNLTTVLQVNGGNDITVNTRYEILASALPANFLNSDGTIRDLDVKVEIFNNSGVGIADWFTPQTGAIWNAATGELVSTGIAHEIIGDRIYMATAGFGSGHGGVHTRYLHGGFATNVMGCSANITAAKCRVKLKLSGEAYTVQTA